MKDHGRIDREQKTLRAMIAIYCRGVHKSSASLCLDCHDLLTYAETRLEKCPFAEDKPTCAKCPVHCYQPRRRQQIKAVMGYAGPRMIRRHPLLAVLHWLDGFQKAPRKRSGDVPAEGEK
ncbi:MAG: nitrous oxide-stimulated promoter family protein [bacterium]